MVRLWPRCQWMRPAKGTLSLQKSGDDSVMVLRPNPRPLLWDVFSEQPLLYREFCALDAGDALHFFFFAGSYGFLSARPDEGVTSEPLSAWRELHASLREKVARWDAAAEAGHLPLAGTGDYPDVVATMIAAARELGDELWPNVALQAVYDGATAPSPMALAVSANTLRAALVLQVFLGMLEDRRHVQCEACGRWFDNTPGVGRKDKRLCSPPCRNRLHRQRQKEAG